MPAPITMPQQSDTMTEGTVVKWLKKEGEKVKSGEVIAEIETDKAVMEMEAFDSGTLAAIVTKEGEKAPVGAAIAYLATGKENPAEVKKQVTAGASGMNAPNAGQAPAAVADKPRVAPAGQQTEESAEKSTFAPTQAASDGAANQGTGTISRPDWLKLVGTDPAKAQKLQAAGKVDMSDVAIQSFGEAN